MPDRKPFNDYKQKKPKILIIHNFYQIPGGEDTVVANEKKLLEDNGHEVVLYTRSNNEIRSMNPLKKLLLPFMTIYNPSSAKDIRRIIREKNIDIVHVHNTLNLISPSVYYAALRCGVPVVQTIHNFRFICPGAALYRDGHICEDCVENGLGCALKHGCYRQSKLQTLILVISVLLHKATGIYGRLNYICLTEFNRGKLLTINRKKQIIPPSGVFVKPNFSYFETPESISGRGTGFIYAGRLDELKGIRTLFEAWRLMGEDAPPLTVCGTGPLEDWCRCSSSGLNIEMKGHVDSAEVRRLISASKALVLPTLWYEGFPMTIAEAFSLNTPVICSDLGNTGSIVEEGVTGWKFQAGNAEGLVQAVRRCVASGKETNAAIKAIYEEKYTPDANYRRLDEIYSEVLNANRSAGA